LAPVQIVASISLVHMVCSSALYFYSYINHPFPNPQFSPDNGGGMILWNTGIQLKDYMA
jgi:hypothetical protein